MNYGDDSRQSAVVDEADLSAPGGGPGGVPFQIDWTDYEPIDPEHTLRRRPKPQIKFQALQSLVNRRVREWNEARGSSLEEWTKNRDYYDGTRNKHWDVKRTGGRDMPWKQRLSPNICKTSIDDHIAIVRQREVSFRFRPASNDLLDIWKTEMASHVATYQDRYNDPDLLLDEAMLAGSLFGNAFIKVYKDYDCGRIISEDENGDTVREVVARMVVLSPYEFCVDPSASLGGNSGLATARWAFHQYRLSADALVSRLTPEQQDRVIRTEHAHLGEGEWPEWDSLTDPNARENHIQTGTTARLAKDEYHVVEYYQRRDPNRFPHGVYALVVNGCIVDADIAVNWQDDESGDMDIPATTFCPTPVPNALLGVELMSLLRPLQDALKKNLSSTLEKLIACSKLKLLLFGADELSGAPINDQHGQLLRFSNPSSRLEVVDIKPPGIDELGIAQAMGSYMDKTVSVFEPSRGEEGRDKTAREAGALVDAANRRVGAIFKRLTRAFEAARRMEFKLIKSSYDLPRFIEASGPDDIAIAEAFMGVDLQGVSDIEVVTDDILPAGSTARISKGLELMAAQVISPQEFREMLGTTATPMLSQEKRIRSRIRREVMEILTPEPGVMPQEPFIDPNQRNDLWVEVMQEIFESTIFDMAPPEAQMLFSIHLSQRVELVTAAAMAASQMEAEASGKGAGDDQPSDDSGAPELSMQEAA